MAANIEAFDTLVDSLKTPTEPLRFAGFEGSSIIKTRCMIIERKYASIFGAVYTYKIPQLGLQSRHLEPPASPRLVLLHKFISSLGGNEVEDDTTAICEHEM